MDSMSWLEKLKGELLFSTTRLVRFDVLSHIVSGWLRGSFIAKVWLFSHVKRREKRVLMLDHEKEGEVLDVKF